MLSKIACASVTLVTLLARSRRRRPRTADPPWSSRFRSPRHGRRPHVDRLSLYLPDSFVAGKSSHTIIRKGPTSMQGEWANVVCPIRLR